MLDDYYVDFGGPGPIPLNAGQNSVQKLVLLGLRSLMATGFVAKALILKEIQNNTSKNKTRARTSTFKSETLDFHTNMLKNNNILKFDRIYEDYETPSTISKICDPRDIITLVHTENYNASKSKSVEEDAEVVLDLVEFLISKNIEPKNIGIIAPYRAQVALIRRKIEGFISRIDKSFCSKVMVDTIDRFQGDERDVIIFSMCFSNSIKSSLLNDNRKVNVALSRAKKKLIVVGNWDLANKYKVFQSLFNYVGENKDSKLIRI